MGNLFFISPLIGTTLVLTALTILSVVLWGRRKTRLDPSVASLDHLGSHLLPIRERMIQIREELDRARRYERSLSVAVLCLDEDEWVDGAYPVATMSPEPDAADERFRSLRLGFLMAGYIIDQSIRDTDIVAYDVSQDYYVLCFPELTQLQGEQTLQRITDLVSARSRVPLRRGCVEFPRDGYTLDDLISSARKQINREQAVPQGHQVGASAKVHRLASKSG